MTLRPSGMVGRTKGFLYVCLGMSSEVSRLRQPNPAPKCLEYDIEDKNRQYSQPTDGYSHLRK